MEVAEREHVLAAEKRHVAERHENRAVEITEVFFAYQYGMTGAFLRVTLTDDTANCTKL